jgi:hypothetical protein
MLASRLCWLRNSCLGLSPPDGREQGLEGKVGRHAGLGGPAGHATREEVDRHRQIQPPLMGLAVGDVRHPDALRGDDLELPVQGIGRDRGRLATIATGTALVANLCGDARKASQPDDPVLGNLFP